MNTILTLDTSPRVASAGQVLADQLKRSGQNQSELADLLARPTHVVNDLISGKREIDFDLANELAIVFPNVSPQAWLEFERQHRAQQSRSELEAVEARVWIAKEFPYYRDLQSKGWLEKLKDPKILLEKLKAFMAPAEQGKVQGAFKLSEARQKLSLNLLAWQVQVFRQAQQLETPPYQSLSEADIQELLAFTRHPEGVIRAVEWVRAQGIKLVFVSHLQKCPVDGVANYNDGQPYIGMSLRYGKLDTFWFVLLHEINHILHQETGHQPDLLEDPISREDPEEQRANQDARNWLIQPGDYREFLRCGDFSLSAIEAFASKIGRHEAIVVGRLKFDGYLPYSKFVRVHENIRDLFTDELI